MNYFTTWTDTLSSVPKTLNFFPYYISSRCTDNDSICVYIVKIMTINLVNIHHPTQLKIFFLVMRTLKNLTNTQYSTVMRLLGDLTLHTPHGTSHVTHTQGAYSLGRHPPL